MTQKDGWEHELSGFHLKLSSKLSECCFMYFFLLSVKWTFQFFVGHFCPLLINCLALVILVNSVRFLVPVSHQVSSADYLSCFPFVNYPSVYILLDFSSFLPDQNVCVVSAGHLVSCVSVVFSQSVSVFRVCCYSVQLYLLSYFNKPFVHSIITFFLVYLHSGYLTSCFTSTCDISIISLYLSLL